MKAVVMSAIGGPEVLRMEEAETPTPGEHEIRVRLKAAGVNPVDTKLRSRGTYYPDNMPTILGCDGAGVVDAVGTSVSRFREGDAVYFCNGGIGGHPGNYAEYAVIDEQFAATKPASLDFNQAAAAPLVLITAWESLHDRAAIRDGHKVLVHAGAGGVGHVAIQLARAAGAEVCATVGDEAKADFVRELGAEPILYKERDFAQATLAWSGGEGVDIAFDTVGGATFAATFAAVRIYGDLVSLLQPPSEVDWKVARNRNLRTSLELMLIPMYQDLREARIHQREILDTCAKLFDEGKLKIQLNRVLPLAEAAEAHRLIEAGGMSGKLVLEID